MFRIIGLCLVFSLSVQGQILGAAEVPYRKGSRITNQGGTMTFRVRGFPRRLFISTEDAYGSRSLGLRHGFSDEDFAKLLLSVGQNKGIFCPLLEPLVDDNADPSIVADLGYLAAFGYVGTLLVGLGPYIASLPVLLSLGEICAEQTKNSRTATNDLRYHAKATALLNEMGEALGNRETEFTISLDSSRYWLLHNAITDNSRALSVPRINGGGRGSRGAN